MPKIKIAIILLLISLGIFLSTYCLQYNPSSWFDEGIYIQISNNLFEQNQMAIQVAPNIFEPLTIISVGYPVYYTTALFYKIFGIGFLQARYTAIFFLLLFIFSFFLLNKSLYNKKSAILSTLLLITFAPLYGNGRNLLGDIPGLFFMSAGLLFFSYWEKKGFEYKKYAILSGLFFGLAVATKPNFLVIGGGLLLAFLYNRKKIITNIRPILLFILSGLILFFWWLYTQFNSISVLKEALAHYANPYAKENLSGLIWQNLLRFFTESTPIHFTILVLILTISIIFRYKQKDKINGTEIIIYFFIFFTFISYLRTPGWYRYFFLAHIWLLFTFANSLNILLKNKHFNKKRRGEEEERGVLISIIILLFFISFQGLHLLKTGLSCRESSVDNASIFANEWIKENDNLIFINTPELVARLNTTNYYQFLEINPKIKFGVEYMEFSKQNMYNIIILRDNELNPLANNLQCYTIEKTIGSYKFYKKKLDCAL